MRDHAHWIDGRAHAPEGAVTTIRYSPADGTPVARYLAGTQTEVDLAVAVAKRVFLAGQWRDLPGSEKAALLNGWASLIEAENEALARIEAEEVGKPVRAAREELLFCAELIRYAAALAWELPGRLMSHSGAGKLGMVSYEPRGVVAMITPWNYPAVTLMQKLPFALAAGCSAVIKPSELTSGSTLRVAALASQAGLPDGLVNVVTGSGELVGRPLCVHADVAMVSFTGSTSVGRQIATTAGADLKHVALELGGKGVNILFEDCDLEAAVEGAFTGFTLNQGEECAAASRLLVEETIADEVLERLTARTEAIKIGHPLAESTDMGPLIHAKHLESVLGYVESAQREGARILCGGTNRTDGGLGDGHYIAPTILADVTPDMQVFQEEIFGPVLSVTSFRTMEEAVSLANNTAYGLANGVWSRNIDKALTVSRRLHCGLVYVNASQETIPQLPFGGVKQSGMGRETGLEGILDFMEPKSIYVKIRQPA